MPSVSGASPQETWGLSKSTRPCAPSSKRPIQHRRQTPTGSQQPLFHHRRKTLDVVGPHLAIWVKPWRPDDLAGLLGNACRAQLHYVCQRGHQPQLCYHCLIRHIQVLNQARVPQRVQIAAANERLELIGSAAAILSVPGMQRLMHIGDQMPHVLQSCQPLFSWRIGCRDSQLPVVRLDHTVTVGAVPLRVVRAIASRQVDVVPGRSDPISVLIGPGRDRVQGSSGFERQEFLELIPGLGGELLFGEEGVQINAAGQVVLKLKTACAMAPPTS